MSEITEIMVPILDAVPWGGRLISASEMLGLIATGFAKIRTDGNSGLKIDMGVLKYSRPIINEIPIGDRMVPAGEALGLVAAGLLEIEADGEGGFIGRMASNIARGPDPVTIPVDEEGWPDVEFAKSVSGLYSDEELKNLYEHVRNVPDGSSVLEIGVWRGKTASILLMLARKKALKVFLIDAWTGAGKYEYPYFTEMVAKHFMDVPHVLVNGTSSSAVDLLKPQRFSFIHIDGDHGYASVREDCENWLPQLIPGGVACFHDYEGNAVTYSYIGIQSQNHETWVKKAVDECCTPDKWEKLKTVYSQASFRKKGD